MSTTTAFVRVHYAQEAWWIILGCSLGAVILRNLSFAQIGPIRPSEPIALAYVFPMVLGFSVALSCERHFELRLPVPPRERVACLFLVVTTLGLALVISIMSALLATGVEPESVVRNCLFLSGVSLVGSILGPRLMWLPGFGWMLASMLFGSSMNEQGPSWAFLVHRQVAFREMAACIVVLGAGLCVRIWSPRPAWVEK